MFSKNLRNTHNKLMEYFATRQPPLLRLQLKHHAVKPFHLHYNHCETTYSVVVSFCLHALVFRVGTKPGLWTLDWTMDWTMDWIMDWIMDSILDLILDRTATNIVFRNIPGLPTIQLLIASSLVPKVMIIQTSMHFFQRIWQHLKPSQCIGRYVIELEAEQS